MPEIGFLIVGAPKAGTTSLFEYMRTHPEIHMPAEKELYFFNVDRNYRRGWDWYERTVTRSAPPHAVCGEATTEYISGAPYLDPGDTAPEDDATSSAPLEQLIPRRIKRALPDVRLICVLRDPVRRAYSHYRMMVLNRIESRSFGDAVADLTSPEGLVRSKQVRTRSNGYVVNGEYARLLDGFLSVFPLAQLKVVFSDDLATRPAETVADVFRFVGVTGDFLPETIGTRYREAAVQERVPGLNLIAWQLGIARSGLARSLWHALPDRMRSSVDRAYNVANYRVEMWNGRRGVPDHDFPADVHRALVQHYLPDSTRLATMLNREVPWLADWSATEELARTLA